MDSASSSSSASPPFRSSAFKGSMKTAQQRYKQEQFLRDQRKAEEAVAAAERVRRDRMSRGKDPYCSDDASDESEQHGSSASTSKYRLGGSAEQEDFGKKERREKAVAFLDSPELLMMYAQSKGDSIPAARLHFMKMMCGYDDESIAESASNNYYVATHTSTRQARQGRDSEKRRGGERASGR